MGTDLHRTRHVATTRRKPDELRAGCRPVLAAGTPSKTAEASPILPASDDDGGRVKSISGDFVDSRNVRAKVGSVLIQLHRLSKMSDDDFSEFRGADDDEPAGPTEEPECDLIQPIDGEAQGDAAVLVTLDLLGGVPGGFGDQFGGSRVNRTTTSWVRSPR